MSTQDIWQGGTGNWNTPGSWSTGADPLTGQDAFVGEDITATVTTTANETVNSIGVDGNSSILEINNNSTFTATDGTMTNPSDTGTVFSGVGPSGNILVDAGSNLVIGDRFANEGAIEVGAPVVTPTSGTANLKISGQATLTGSGTLDLGADGTSGFIVNAGSGDGLTNANNKITGNGLIALANFDNQAGGTVEVSGGAGSFLDVYATGTWKNEGQMIAESGLTFDLGANATTTTLANAGSIVIDQSGNLAISGTFTLTGSGSLNFAGSGEITTNGSTPATFINENTIESDVSAAQIGGSALTFDNNGGTVEAAPGAFFMTINTGSITVTDDDGGLFEAEGGSTLYIRSPVNTGGFFNVNTDTGGGGTIRAANGGVVVIDGAIAPGGSGQDFLDGDVEIGNFGTVLTGASISVPITFSGTGGILQISDASVQVTGQISGFAAGDFLDLQAIPFSGATLNWSENRSGTSGVLTVSNGSTSETFDINGDFSTSSFNLFSDGIGGQFSNGIAGSEVGLQNPPPSGGTTAVMVMSNFSETSSEIEDTYEIYDIGSNAFLGAATLGEIMWPWVFSGLGDFNGSDTSDMLLRSSSTGAVEAYYIANNTINTSVLVGTVGLNYAFSGIGDFNGTSSLSELLLRNSSSGAFELYQVSGGGVLSGSAVAAVGNNFSVEGFGFFSESSTTQMMMQGNSGASLGQLELYTYQPNSASFTGIDVGKIGTNLTFLGCADLLRNGSTQMMMQQNNGDLWLYTYNASANALNGQEIGAVGSNFHVVGFGPLGSSGQDEMLMQDAAGDFEVYQYNSGLGAFVGTAMGAVGTAWSVEGIAADPPGGASSGLSAQLIQAMASMNSSTSVSTASNSTVGAEASSLTSLTTPQHA